MTLADITDNYRHLHQLLFLYALKQCHDPVLSEHVVGDVIARVFEKIAVQGLEIRNQRAFLYTSVYNGIVDDHRQTWRHVPLKSLVRAHWLGSSQPVESLAEQQVLIQAVLERMKRLTSFQRHVIVLRYMEGVSLKETARLLGRNKNSVKAAAQRAMKSLRRLRNE